MSGAIALMYQLESKADAAGTPDWKRSLLYLILTLVGKIESMSGQVADIGKQANAFSDVKSDITNMQKDISKLQKWITEHPGKTAFDAMHDKDYTDAVEQFKKDYAQYKADAHDPNNTKYDGMSDATKNAEKIGNTTFDLPITGSKTIDQMVNGNDPDLGRALFQGARGDSTAFADWSDGSVGLDAIGMKFGTMIQNFDQDLSTKGNMLQQIQGAGQNMTSSTGTLMNVIIQHLAEHA